MTPLVLGDVSSARLDIQVDRVGTLLPHLAETRRTTTPRKFPSAAIRSCALMATRAIVGIPSFIMRGFRHRCIITTEDSPIDTLSDLAGKRIGVTGWRDSGNTWTRAALRREGVGVEDAFWFAGRLTEPPHRRSARRLWPARPDRGGSRRTSHDGTVAGGRARRDLHALHARRLSSSGVAASPGVAGFPQPPKSPISMKSAMCPACI